MTRERGGDRGRGDVLQARVGGRERLRGTRRDGRIVLRGRLGRRIAAAQVVEEIVRQVLAPQEQGFWSPTYSKL